MASNSRKCCSGLISFIFIFLLTFQVDRIIFCVFSDRDREVYEEALQIFFPVPPASIVQRHVRFFPPSILFSHRLRLNSPPLLLMSFSASLSASVPLSRSHLTSFSKLLLSFDRFLEMRSAIWLASSCSSETIKGSPNSFFDCHHITYYFLSSQKQQEGFITTTWPAIRLLAKSFLERFYDESKPTLPFLSPLIDQHVTVNGVDIPPLIAFGFLCLHPQFNFGELFRRTNTSNPDDPLSMVRSALSFPP